MLKLENLDGIKLVSPDNFASDGFASNAIERAVLQGSGGWGVTEYDSVILKLAGDLKIALALSEALVGVQNQLKGKQLELGRVKAQLDAVKLKLDKVS